MKDVNCPYCGHAQDINHDDGYGYDENENHEQDCTKCGEPFGYTTGIIFVYHVFKKGEEDKDDA